MTLTLLLQLTDEEQLYAFQPIPVEESQEQVEVAPAAAVDDGVAQWPIAMREDC
ncbi:MAG TPA: hypothetical protein PKD45_13475 [Flavobacteriales bacterium]|nr:hypothetical protein [Flavobacteriales bacterium]